jgi:hypothetical protein
MQRDARYRAFDHEPELRERWLKVGLLSSATPTDVLRNT